MSVTYTIDRKESLIEVEYSDVVTIADVTNFIDGVIADPKFRPGMNSISDMSQAMFDWSARDIDRFRAYVDDIKGKVGECKWALVAHEGITQANAQIFTILQEVYGDTIEVKLFTNRYDAMEWLKKPKR